MKPRPDFFDFAAQVGLTKHIGGRPATDALVAQCHIEAGARVLDVGCGVGVTPVYLARKYGYRVVGVDISEMMIGRAQERARRAGLGDALEFTPADAQDLPFDDEQFDAVITESVTAFPKDKARAVAEYARVTKAGGYVGLNESVWLTWPPAPEILAWVAQDVGADVQPLTAAGWEALLRDAGLRDIVAQSFKVNIEEEARGILRRYGLGEALRIIGRMLALYARDPSYRGFVKEVRGRGVTPAGLNETFGYGLFVGRK
jgi:ubiquinone/menaquinone biosynthesis C-methylase UbiE